MHAYTPQALKLRKIWQLHEGHEAANCSFASTDDRQTETVSYIFGTDSFLFVCLFACSQLQFILSPGPVNSIISDYFLISAAALIHLLVTYLFLHQPTIVLREDVHEPGF